MLRRIIVGLLMLSVAACAGSDDLDQAPVGLGDFKLGYNIAVAPKVVKGPLSRSATKEELTDAVKAAVAARFDRYEGDKLYHFGVSVESYVLAAPGIPLVLAPKSIMILLVTVWDDAENAKLNARPKQITVVETFGKGKGVGTGYTLTAEEQLANLSQNAAKSIELYLVEQMENEGWFTGKTPQE